jgi:uncharacterized membrane protein YccC
MPESHEKQFREQADECHRKAQQAANSLEKETWQRLADDWLKLAEQAERQRQRLNYDRHGQDRGHVIGEPDLTRISAAPKAFAYAEGRAAALRSTVPRSNGGGANLRQYVVLADDRRAMCPQGPPFLRSSSPS